MPVSQETEECKQRGQLALNAYRSGLSEYNSIRKSAAAHGVSQPTLGDRVRGLASSKEEAAVRQRKQKGMFYPSIYSIGQKAA